MSGAVSQPEFPPLSAGNLKRIRSLHQKKYRDAEGAFIVEGIRLCEEALASKMRIRQAVTTADAMKNERLAALISECSRRAMPVFQATAAQFRTLSEEPAPQGLAFIVDKPGPKIKPESTPLILALDRLQDPGNLGTILRSAEWFGVPVLLLGEGTVDAGNAKVVRSAMGALFRLSLYEKVDLPQQLSRLKSAGYRIIGTAAGAGITLPEAVPSQKDVLLIGNEGSGLSDKVAHSVDDFISIPGAGGESLNAAVAASIFLYHFSVFKREDHDSGR